MGERLLTDVKRLGSRAAVYGLGSIFTRALIFFLLPVFTRVLTPAEYGIVSLAASVIAILGFLYPLGLHGALTQFYFATQDPHGRRETVGTIWFTMVGAGLITALLLDRLGGAIFGAFIPRVPFDPYLRIAVWTAFCTALSLVPLNLLRFEERPLSYVTLTVGLAVTTIALSLGLVVLFKGGARGYLLGGLIANLIFVVPYVVVTMRRISWTVRRSTAMAALAYSLPLVPHAAASWVLDLSDRALLTHFVSLADVGIYSLGYQLGSAISLVVVAFNTEWTPFLFQRLAQNSVDVARISRLATYYWYALVWVVLGVALFGGVAVHYLVAPSYAGATVVIPWVALGGLLNGAYIIPVTFLFWHKATSRIPVITLVAGTVNVLCNLWLIPRVGMIGAAWATAIAYGVMLWICWLFAQRVFPFPYEYGYAFRMLIVGMVLFVIGDQFALTGAGILGRAVCWLALPAAAVLVGAISSDDLARVRQLRWRGA